MSLTATLANATDTAFAAVGDLVQIATLRSKTVDGFDWATSQVDYTDSPPVLIPVVPYEVRREDGVPESRALVKESDFPGSLYNLLELPDGKTYRVVDSLKYFTVYELTLESFDDVV